MTSTSRIDIRLTEEEKQLVKAKAEQLGMTISEYVRFVAIHAEVSVRADMAEGKDERGI